MIELKVDGMDAQVEDGGTLLGAAQSVGVKIPTLCYHPELLPYGSCRVCVVEIARPTAPDKTRLVASCVYPAEPGLIVKTDTERVRNARKVVMGLLLARCPDSEVLQQLAAEYGVKKDTDDKVAKFLVDRVSKEEESGCILCGLCVRVCTEVVERNATTFSLRGKSRKVTTPFSRISDTCIGCGACAYVCPLNTIEVEQAT